MVETKAFGEKDMEKMVDTMVDRTGLDKEFLVYLAVREWAIKHGSRETKRELGIDNHMWVGQMIDLDNPRRYGVMSITPTTRVGPSQ